MLRTAGVNPFDSTVFHAVNGLAGHSSWLDHVMIFFAKDALELYALLFIVAWFALPKKDLQSRHALFMAGLSGILALIINVLISHVWFRPRPFTVFHHDTQLVSHSKDASFPSDHASGSFGFAAGSWGKQQKWISVLFTVIAVIVMFARVYVGVHYPTDVLASVAVGIIASKVLWKLSRFIYPTSVRISTLYERLFNRMSVKDVQ